MKLNCAGAMHHAFGCNVGFMGEFFCFKVAQRFTDAICANYGAPPARVLIDTKHPRAAVALRLPLILQVPGTRYLSKIRNSVVCSDAVSMVNYLYGERPVGVKPRKPVQRIGAEINLNSKVAVPFVERANRGVNRNAVACFNASGKYSSIRVVMEKFTQTFCGKIGSSHAVVPLKQWFGQRPARVDSTSGLRHFNTQED